MTMIIRLSDEQATAFEVKAAAQRPVRRAVDSKARGIRQQTAA